MRPYWAHTRPARTLSPGNPLHFATYAATLYDTRLGRWRLHVSPHRSRRGRTDYGIRTRLPRTLATVQRPSLSTAQRHRHSDRVESSPRSSAGDDAGYGIGRIWMVAPTRSTEQGAGRSRPTCHSDPARRDHCETRIAGVDGHSASGHGDAVASDIADHCDLTP